LSSSILLYPLSLHDALPILADVGRDGFRRLAAAVDQHDFTRAAPHDRCERDGAADISGTDDAELHGFLPQSLRRRPPSVLVRWQDRKSTRLNSSHQIISYAV